MLPPSLSTTRRVSASLRCPRPRQRVSAVPETASARLCGARDRVSASLRCPRPRQRVSAVPETASARLAVHRVLAVLGAELLQLEPVGVVPPVLARDVVPALALLAGQGDLRTDVGGCHGALLALSGPGRSQGRESGCPHGAATRRRTPGERGPSRVAVTGFEPVTQRL